SAPHLPTMPIFTATDSPTHYAADELAEAHRALKGKVLRTEVYAEDGSEVAAFPYVVTEATYEVRRLQKKGKNPHGVFLCVPRESFSAHFERAADTEGHPTDPFDSRVAHDVALVVDDHGHVTKSATVAYPRKYVPEITPAVDEQGVGSV